MRQPVAFRRNGWVFRTNVTGDSGIVTGHSGERDRGDSGIVTADSNGMDAPTLNGIICAKVELAYQPLELNRSVHHEGYNNRP